jgi:hypothetical protein
MKSSIYCSKQHPRHRHQLVQLDDISPQLHFELHFDSPNLLEFFHLIVQQGVSLVQEESHLIPILIYLEYQIE